jgi:hypothetical protein
MGLFLLGLPSFGHHCVAEGGGNETTQILSAVLALCIVIVLGAAYWCEFERRRLDREIWELGERRIETDEKMAKMREAGYYEP